MKTIISTILIVLLSVSLFAISPVKVYNKTSVYSSDVICNLNNSKVYKKNSVYTSDVVCNIRDNKIYKANSVYTSDIIATIRDGKVYKGTSVYTSDVLFHFDGYLTLVEFVAVWYAVMYAW